MKKFLLIIAVVAMVLQGCKKIEESIDATNARIDKLEQKTIPTIDEQIAAINVSLDALDAMDKELKGYIDGLQATADNLQEQINATNTKIGEVKAELQGEISTAKAEVLAELEALETELKNELAQINATIETLKAKDEELDKKIADLKTYVDTELGKTADWVEATFATLEQYNALVKEVTAIKAQIEAINKSIKDLETKLTTKINEDIANAVASLSADIQQKVKEITDAYTDAIKSAKEEITAAYTTAIQNAINALETSLKSWVGDQLSNYYKIAEIDAKILALQNNIKKGDEALQIQLDLLKEDLQTMKIELTTAYQKAIQDAITTNNGVIEGKIADAVAEVNQRINSEVETINAKISAIEARLNNIEAQVKDLLARIQSVSYIPEYADGKVVITRMGSTSSGELSFRISPKDAVVELEKVWSEALSCEAYYPKTRAVSLVKLAVTEYVADAESGVITVKVSGEGLSDEFFAGTQEAKVALVVSDGNNQVVSDYADAIGKEITDEIWYTSTDGAIIKPYKTGVFGANIVSNTYENGKGIIKFDGPVTMVGKQAFAYKDLLKTIVLPNSVTLLGTDAFASISYLESIDMGLGVETLEGRVFKTCGKLKSLTFSPKLKVIPAHAVQHCYVSEITIPESVEVIEDYAFEYCKVLKSFYGKYASMDGRSLIVNGRLVTIASNGLTEYTVPSEVTSVAPAVICTNNIVSFSGNFVSEDATMIICDGVLCGIACAAVVDLVVPDGVTHISPYISYLNTRIKSIVCPDSVTEISFSFPYCPNLQRVVIGNGIKEMGVAPSGSGAFYHCPNLANIVCKAITPPVLLSDKQFGKENNEPYTIYVPMESVDAYKTAEYWSSYADHIVAGDF